MKTRKIKVKGKTYVYHDYPPEQGSRSGCKVGWLIYDRLEDATAAAAAAAHNAENQWALGYDFGYCSPGTVRVLDNGQFQVCIP